MRIRIEGDVDAAVLERICNVLRRVGYTIGDVTDTYGGGSAEQWPGQWTGRRTAWRKGKSKVRIWTGSEAEQRAAVQEGGDS